MPTRPTDDIVAGATPADGTPDDAINAYRPSSPPETLRRF